MSLRTLAISILMATSVSTVFAQDHQSTGVFVAAGVHAAGTKLPLTSVAGTGFSIPDISGVTAGGSIAIGTFVRPVVSLRVEVSTAGRLAGSYAQPSPYRTIDVSFPGDETLRNAPDSHVNRSTRDRDVFVLAGYHAAPTRRVRVAYLAGVTLQHTTTTVHDTDYVARYTSSGIFSTPSLVTFEEHTTSSKSSNIGAGVALGVDVDVALSRRVTLAPLARVVAQGGALSVRPGVQVRLGF